MKNGAITILISGYLHSGASVLSLSVGEIPSNGMAVLKDVAKYFKRHSAITFKRF